METKVLTVDDMKQEYPESEQTLRIRDATTKLANGKEIKVINRVFTLAPGEKGTLKAQDGSTYVRGGDGSLRNITIPSVPKRLRAKMRRGAKNGSGKKK